MNFQTIFFDSTSQLQNDVLLSLDNFSQYSKPFLSILAYELEVGIQTMKITDVDRVVFSEILFEII